MKEPDWRQCATCGELWTTLNAGGVCMDCAGIAEAQRLAKIEEEYRASPQYRTDWLTAAGVPARYLSPFEGEPKSWDHHAAPTLIISGPVGVGKTYLAVELAWRARIGGSLFVRATDAVAWELAGDDRTRRLQSARLLILDDLGKNQVGGSWNLVATIYSRRYDEQLPTIITTNLNGGGQLPDEALADRLRDAKTIRMTGKSRRGART